jgi:uncharacterized membrane protein YcjF (UPF0283 family)
MVHSNENSEDNRISEAVRSQRSFTKKMLIALMVLIVVIVGLTLAVSASSQEKRIMAPGPIGSTDSISKPVE